MFHSELASFGNGMIDFPEVVTPAALPRHVQAVPNRRNGCYCTRVIIDVYEARFNAKSEVAKHSNVTQIAIGVNVRIGDCESSADGVQRFTTML